MTTANNPENQQNHAALGSGQINARHTHKPGNPRFHYVVVESPGTEFEKIVYTASRFEIARNWMERHYTDDFCPADVMKRDRDGTLTTEF